MQIREEYQKLFAAVTPVLEDFAQQYKLNLRFNPGEEERFGEPYFQLYWLNAHGCSCFLTVVHRKPDAFRFSAICWAIHDKLGEKLWEPVRSQHVDSEVFLLLNDALHWSDAFTQQSP